MSDSNYQRAIDDGFINPERWYEKERFGEIAEGFELQSTEPTDSPENVRRSIQEASHTDYEFSKNQNGGDSAWE